MFVNLWKHAHVSAIFWIIESYFYDVKLNNQLAWKNFICFSGCWTIVCIFQSTECMYSLTTAKHRLLTELFNKPYQRNCFFFSMLLDVIPGHSEMTFVSPFLKRECSVLKCFQECFITNRSEWPVTNRIQRLIFKTFRSPNTAFWLIIKYQSYFM